MISLHQDDAANMLASLPNRFVDAVITDPPYDDDYPLSELRRVSKGNVVVFYRPEKAISGADEYLFWVKATSTKNYTRNCGRFVEQIAVFRRGETFNRLHWSQMTGVYDDRHVYSELLHPWQKPLSLIERLVRIYTAPGDIVLDPYVGSGTTAAACKRLGRDFIGCDIDISVAERRLAA